MAKKVLVFVGTQKGGFIFESNEKRKRWKTSDIQFKSWNVMHIQMDPRDQRLHAATSHFVYGPTTHYSDDLGKTWTQAKLSPLLSRGSKSGRPASTADEAFRSEGGESIQEKPEKMIKVWNIQPGRESEPNVLYAGAQPASLFMSKDRGETWELNESLYDHPQRGQWNPGAGGLTLHTILLDPGNPNRIFVAISAAGAFRTDDGGETWRPITQGLQSGYELPDPKAEVGHCVHNMALHRSRPDVLFMQKHWDVMRTDNAGESLCQSPWSSGCRRSWTRKPGSPPSRSCSSSGMTRRRPSRSPTSSVWRRSPRACRACLATCTLRSSRRLLSGAKR